MIRRDKPDPSTFFRTPAGFLMQLGVNCGPGNEMASETRQPLQNQEERIVNRESIKTEARLQPSSELDPPSTIPHRSRRSPDN